jgi:uncharacterized membrane protein YjjP (DUF1212 family)
MHFYLHGYVVLEKLFWRRGVVTSVCAIAAASFRLLQNGVFFVSYSSLFVFSMVATLMSRLAI